MNHDFAVPPALAQTWGSGSGMPAGQAARGYLLLADINQLQVGNFISTNSPLELPSQDAPRPPYELWRLLRISVPVIAMTANAGGQPQVTTTYLRLFAEIHGRDVWAVQEDLPMIHNTNLVNSAGYDVLQGDFVNPPEIFDHRALRIGYSIAFDQTTTFWDVAIGCDLSSFATINGQISPGIVTYERTKS